MIMGFTYEYTYQDHEYIIRKGGGGVLVEWESPVPSSDSVLGSNPTKAFGFSVEG